MIKYARLWLEDIERKLNSDDLASYLQGVVGTFGLVFFAVTFILVPVKMLESKSIRDTWYLPMEVVEGYICYLACSLLAAIYSIGNFICGHRRVVLENDTL